MIKCEEEEEEEEEDKQFNKRRELRNGGGNFTSHCVSLKVPEKKTPVVNNLGALEKREEELTNKSSRSGNEPIEDNKDPWRLFSGNSLLWERKKNVFCEFEERRGEDSIEKKYFWDYMVRIVSSTVHSIPNQELRHGSPLIHPSLEAHSAPFVL